MPFEIVRNDITQMNTDAIVNAANSQLQAGGGVCGAIFTAAGHRALQAACDAIGHCPVGSAVITPGYGLQARYVIHAVGPIWRGGAQGEEQLLRSCYLEALKLAERNDCQSVAFPLISAGIYGYPKQQALETAVAAIREFLRGSDMRVVLVLFDKTALALAQPLQHRIQSYIDDHYVERAEDGRRRQREVATQRAQLQEQRRWFREQAIPADMEEDIASCPVQPCAAAAPECKKTGAQKKRNLRDLLGNLDESFSKMLLRLIDEKNLTDVQVYKRANLDRKLFSKLRKDGYNPGKPTALALAIALELNLDQTRDLLAKAGYALSPCNKFDVIISYFIEEEIYDIYAINEALFYYDQHLLGA